MDERNEAALDEANASIPTVDDTFSHFVGTAREVIARYTHCTLCGANLHFTHVTNFATNLTEETAKCPECGIKARHIVHRLQ